MVPETEKKARRLTCNGVRDAFFVLVPNYLFALVIDEI